MPQAGRIPGFADAGTNANFYLLGARKARIYCVVQGALQGAAQSGPPNIQIGDKDAQTYGPGPAAPGNSDDVICGATCTHIQAGQPGVLIINSDGVLLDGLILSQAATPGTGYGALGVVLGETGGSYPNATNIRFGSINGKGVDGALVTVIPGSSGFMTGGDIIPGQAGLPNLPPSPALQAIIASGVAAAFASYNANSAS